MGDEDGDDVLELNVISAYQPPTPRPFFVLKIIKHHSCDLKSQKKLVLSFNVRSHKREGCGR